jgi:hemerythrin-like domain-containing protein
MLNKNSREAMRMKPIGPMMREHRLIERMLGLLDRELGTIEAKQEADPVFIDTAVDFFRTYADRTHHGKEEEIYFRDLEGKDLSEDLRRILEELIAEHVEARRQVKALVEANERYAAGDRECLEDIKRVLATLIEFYPRHIEKEDKHFFFPTQEYFSESEQDIMLQEFKDFDAMMIHDKYSSVVKRIEGSLL